MRDDGPDVAEGRVEGVGRRVDPGGLAAAHDDGARAAVGRELLGDLGDPPRGHTLGVGRPYGGTEGRDIDAVSLAELPGQGQEVAPHATRGEAQAVVGVGAGEGEDTLDHVEAAHLLLGRLEAAQACEASGVAHGALLGQQEVRIERQDGAGRAVVDDVLDGTAEGRLRSGTRVRLVDRGPRVDPGARHVTKERLTHSHERRRPRWLGQDPEPPPAGGGVLPEDGAECRVEVGEGLVGKGPALLRRRGLRAIRVVEIEDRTLSDEVGAASARRMQRVALDLRGTPLMARHVEPEGLAPAVHHSGERQGDAREHVLRAPREGDDVLDRPPDAAREARRGRRTGHGEEAAAADQGPDVEELVGARAGFGGKLGFGLAAKGGRIGVLLFEAAPDRRGIRRHRCERVGLATAHRWHPLQFVGGFTEATR